MATVINSKKASAVSPRTSGVARRLREVLPGYLFAELERLMDTYGAVEEIRLRSGRRAYVTLGGGRGNVALELTTDPSVLTHVLDRVCDGSLYAYSESITKGYVSVGEGIRMGVCGRASVEGGRILGIYDISALNIRLPCERVKVGQKFLSAVRKSIERGEGVLIYSPPAQGKTTLLKALSYELASGRSPMRVALVDTREELYVHGGDGHASIDLLSGYPKAEGIRIATAFMNPQVIICDEIGDTEEANAIAEAQNSGVPLIASTHGSSLCGILRREGMRSLFLAGVFGLYVGISVGADGAFEYVMNTGEEIDVEGIGRTSHFS